MQLIDAFNCPKLSTLVQSFHTILTEETIDTIFSSRTWNNGANYYEWTGIFAFNAVQKFSSSQLLTFSIFWKIADYTNVVYSVIAIGNLTQVFPDWESIGNPDLQYYWGWNMGSKLSYYPTAYRSSKPNQNSWSMGQEIKSNTNSIRLSFYKNTDTEKVFNTSPANMGKGIIYY